MIFEANHGEIKKALTMIQNTLTATELNKNDFSMIQLHVSESGVYFSCQVENQLEYQINIPEAEPILEGSLYIKLQDLMEIIKSFDKNTITLLFERDGMELRIDDGVLSPEVMILTEQNELEEKFLLEHPTGYLSLPVKWFSQRLEIAKINNRTTFLPATSSILIATEENQLIIRSFNLTNLYESKKIIEDTFSNQAFLIGKNSTARITRLLKSIKEEDVQVYWNPTGIYLFTSNIVFRFPEEPHVESIAILKSLPVEEMKNSTLNTPFKTSDFLKYTSVKKGEEAPEVIEVNEQDLEHQITRHSNIPPQINAPMYPFKVVQKIASKWMNTIDLSIGLNENCNPLILQHKTNETSDTFIVMGYTNQSK